MALKSEAPNTGSPADYSADHPTEQPSDWGWHGEFSKLARFAGWLCVVILVAMTTATHYNHAGTLALLITAAVLVIGLVTDINVRRNSWRR